jgi:hypothetical protein
MKFLISLFSALALVLSVAGPAQAQGNARSWVSSTGSDSNGCSRELPCATFTRAVATAGVGGEINCVDAGSFNPVAITKSITIDCHDVFAGVRFTGIGILIDFATFAADDTLKRVRLRNMSLGGIDAGQFGIKITGANSAGSTIFIEDSLIDGNNLSTARGIDDTRSGGGKLIVKNTTIRNYIGAAISVLPAGGSANIQVFLDNVRAQATGTGAQFGNLVRATIDQSAFVGNAGAGILAASGAIVNVDRSTMTQNANGVQAAGGVIVLSNSNISLNTSQGINISGGSVFSFGNNRIVFNASPGTAPSPAGSASSDLGQQ